ncbi:hypothetical protein GCM10023176_37170 [Micromonospora coerulea]|uniref:DUF11 domain-containing protein n=1 Tax=Micromonospora coerulea TaxID=47856 RepID=A0ABP8SP19_9ACTN
MANLPVRPDRRVVQRRTSVLLAAALATGLATAVAVAPAWATASPTATSVVTAVTDPAGDPETDPTDTTPPVEPTATEPVPTTAPPTESAPPETTPPAPPTTEPAPVTTAPADPVPITTAPTTTAPAPPPVVPPARPPVQPGPGQPAAGQLGVRVTTEDVSLTPAYWNADSTVTTLRVTVTNTGSVPELIRLAYTLPIGLADAGTPGCAPADGGSYRCGGWPAAPGDRFSSSIKVRVSATAWRSMPLSGSVGVTATAAGVTGAAADNQGFAVLFPPGPPVPGISLRADDVLFDISGAPSAVTVRLGNTGRVDAAGRVDVILPDGVTVSGRPAGCAPLPPSRTRCDLGTVPAGRTATLRLPVTATAEAQRRAPLAGAVVGRLDPRSGRARQVQMSFRITAAAALSTPIATPVPTGSQGVLAAAAQGSDDGGLNSVQRTAVTLIGVSGVIVVLALVLATTSLRRRMSAAPTEPTTAPAGSD